MKKIYTLDALKFGFATFFKNPLFFIFAILVSKMIFAIGLLISLFLTFPFFINFIKTFKKIFNQGKALLSELSLNSIVKDGAKELSAGSANNTDGPIGDLINGLGKIASGIGDVFVEKLYEVKLLLAEVLQNKLLFALFLFGAILFIIFIKMTYDFVMIGWVKISLDFYDKKQGSIKSFFNSPSIWIRYVLATALFLLISSIPTIIYFWFYLLISYFIKIPNIISFVGYAISVIYSWCLVLKLWFYPYYIFDEGVGIIDSLKRSYNMGLGFLNVVISMFIFVVIIGIPFVIAFNWPHIVTFAILGIIFAIIWVVSWMSYAYLYGKLKA